MKISIGILAWNEESSIRATLHSVFSQSLLRDLEKSGHEIDLICIPNGCTDNTVLAARGAMLAAAERLSHPVNLSWKVHPLEKPGKTNAWNVFVHELVDPQTDVIFLVDADIQIYMPDTLSNMLDQLMNHPDAFICTDLPVKHIVFKQRYSLLDQISMHTARINQSASGQLCGQLYCARAAWLRRLWIPEGIIVEDGFIKKMAVSNFLTETENAAQRIVVAETASHVFEAYTRLPDVLATHRRQIAGYMIHRWIWETLQVRRSEAPDAAALIEQLNRTEPGWSRAVIADGIKKKDYVRIYRILLATRIARFRGFSASKKMVFIPALLVQLLLDSIQFLAALRLLCRGKLQKVWRDTRTTNTEVTR
ncbi:MAG: glycosyltransferase family 2 protein [Kiritimatiellaceae bacterium]|nr:glycosyltransferase family 2 protein [Kiritimatiellaceae bacterium]